VLVVSSGGIVNGVTVSSGGTIDIEASGQVSGLHLLPGAHEFVRQTIGDSQFISGVIVSSGNTLEVDGGGSATDVTVLSGGQLVYAGGNITSATFRKGGAEAIQNGVTVS